MGSRGRLTGRRTQSGSENLREILLAFIQADTWDQSRRIVEQHPELLTDETDALLEQLIEAARMQEDENAQRTFEQHRVLLLRCREVGTERAFADLTGVSPPSEEEIRRSPLYPLAESVLRGETPLEVALEWAVVPETLAALDGAAINQMDDYIIALSRDPARPPEACVLAYLLAELNYAAAHALPASAPLLAYVANTLGNCIDDYPFKTLAQIERQVFVYQEALAIWQQCGDAQLVAMMQNNVGNAYVGLSQVREREANLKQAIAFYRESLNVHTLETLPLDYAMTQNNLGCAYWYLSQVKEQETNLERAIAAYQKALAVYTPQTAPSDYAMTQNNLGNAYADLSKLRDRGPFLEKAISAYRKALAIFTPRSAPMEYAMVQNNLGNAYADLAQIQDREVNLRRAIAAYRAALRFRLPDMVPLDYAETQNNLGNAYWYLSQVREPRTNLEQAMVAYQKALTVYSREVSPLDYAMVQNNLGLVYQHLAEIQDRGTNLKRAITAYREALAIYAARGNLLECVLVQNNIGVAYRHLAQVQDRETNLRRAMEAFQGALANCAPDTDPLGYAMTQNNLGNVYADLAQWRDHEVNLERAIAAYQEALRFRTPEANPIEYAGIQNNLGNVYADLAQMRDRERYLEQAVGAYREALRFRTPETAPLDHAITQNNLGLVYWHLAGVRERETHLQWAIEAYQRGLLACDPEASPLDYAMIQNNLGNAYSELSQIRERKTNLERAIEAYQEALRFYTPEIAPLNYAGTQNNLGNAYWYLAQVRDREKNLQQAIRAFHEALRFRTPGKTPLHYAETQNNLGLAYANLAQVRDHKANIQRAIEAYQRALAIVDHSFFTASLGAQVGLQRRWAGLYASAVSAYLQAGQVAPALAIAEGAKSRVLTGLLGRSAIPAPPVIPGNLAQREQDLAEDLASLDATTFAHLGSVTWSEDLNARLQRLERRRTLVVQLRTLWSEMERYGPEAADYIALRRGDRPNWEDLTQLATDLGSETALLSLFITDEGTYLFILRAGWESPRLAKTALDDTIWDDIGRRFSREVHRFTPSRRETWFDRLRPLLEKAIAHLDGVQQIVLAPQAGHLLPWGALLVDIMPLITVPALGVLKRLWTRRPSGRAGALVVGNSTGDLAHAEAEACQVAEMLGTRPLLGREATVAAVLERLDDVGVAHFATHAYFAPGSPLDSGIVLGDGVLTAREILEAGLRVPDFLALSACQTGMAGQLGGDEFAGLSQAFLYAGARSLLVSLWAVDDPATDYLMTAFYRGWREEGKDRATALREAMLATRAAKPEWTPTYYWGAFTLIGDWR